MRILQSLLCLLIALSASTPQAATYYFHTDHLDTPQVVTDKDQTVVWQGDYKPFGRAKVTTNTIEQNLRFPGQYFDKETGLHYNYFRDYAVGLGRYMQSDPIGLEGGIDTYVYANNNPLVYYDDEGLIAGHIFKCLKNPKKCRKNLCNALNALMHLVCDSARSCKGGDSCPVLRKKRKKLSRCLALRMAVQKCHGRKNDPNPKGHQQIIQEVKNRIKKCSGLLASTDCCNG